MDTEFNKIDNEIEDLKDELQRNFSKKNYRKIHDRANSLLKRSSKLNYHRGKYGALNLLGNASFNICDYEKSHSYFLDSIKVAEEMEDEKSLAFGLNNIGIILFRLKKFEKALDYYKKSLDIKLKHDNKASISTTYNNMGLIYNNLKDYDEALKYFKKSLKIDKEIDNRHAICRELNNIGLVWKFKGDLKKSLRNFQDSYKESEKIGYKKGMASALSNIAVHYLTAGNFDKALEKAFEGKTLAKEIHSNNHIIHFYTTILEAYEKKKDYKNAVKYYKKYIGLKDKILSEDSHNKIVEMQIKYETEKKERESDLYRIKSEELSMLNAKKDKFFRIIHHDLLNPFTAMHSTATFLSKYYDKFDDVKRKNYVNMILGSSERLIKLMDNLFEWVKTQSGEIDYQPEKVDLEEITGHNLELLANNINSKNIKISSKFCKNCYVDADRNMVDTVVRNLIANAIKFTFDEGRIKISTKCTAKKIKFSVEDDGMGIDEENMSKLFDVSQTFTTPGTKDEKGTGLGLILVKEFLDLNKGKISVESEPGKGTKFTVELPTYKLI
ncbi:MAG: tetratricopeptide repeat-containing sensor histidine kinase [Candidatus Delongbacteria bacterium]|nr:tetratricopeptide repeat-containing sensor histidine kinase [Candidatus Delongbacteria bacterium]